MGGSGGGYVPPQRAKFDCDTSVIRTTVSSINTTILSKHSVGTILNVVLGENESLLLEDGDGEILGAILHINTSEIKNCIKNGSTYEAQILTINSPSCTVQIRRR